MHVVERMFFALLVSVILTGCGIGKYYLKESSLLAKELDIVSMYLSEEARVAEEQENEERYSKLYKAVDELAESCTELQEATFKKFFNKVLSFWLKLATVFFLPTCEEKIEEIQRRFPEYKKEYKRVNPNS